MKDAHQRTLEVRQSQDDKRSAVAASRARWFRFFLK
jgi:hypothetical protein